MKNLLFVSLVLLLLTSCGKSRTVVITGNTSTAIVGEEIELTVDASSEKNFKSFVVDAILHTNTGVRNTGRIYFIEDKTKKISDKIRFFIPNEIINTQINPGDYFEFTVFSKIGNEVESKAWKVTITS